LQSGAKIAVNVGAPITNMSYTGSKLVKILLKNQLTARLKILQLTVKKTARFNSKSAKMATLLERNMSHYSAFQSRAV